MYAHVICAFRMRYSKCYTVANVLHSEDCFFRPLPEEFASLKKKTYPSILEKKGTRNGCPVSKEITTRQGGPVM